MNLTDEEGDDSTMQSLKRQARVECRAFARLFRTPDGKLLMASLKAEFGWDAASPMPDKDGNISIQRIRSWTGSRSVIATILNKISMGERLIAEPNETDNQP